MANNYTQFSEVIDDIQPEEAEWIKQILSLDIAQEDEKKDLLEMLGLEKLDDDDADGWPRFEWDLEDKEAVLWLYAEEWANTDHLAWFVQAFIKKFRPETIFQATGADYCSKLRVGEFGGWWLVVSKDHILAGNTWQSAREAIESLRMEQRCIKDVTCESKP